MVQEQGYGRSSREAVWRDENYIILVRDMPKYRTIYKECRETR